MNDDRFFYGQDNERNKNGSSDTVDLRKSDNNGDNYRDEKALQQMDLMVQMYRKEHMKAPTVGGEVLYAMTHTKREIYERRMEQQKKQEYSRENDPLNRISPEVYRQVYGNQVATVKDCIAWILIFILSGLMLIIFTLSGNFQTIRESKESEALMAEYTAVEGVISSIEKGVIRTRDYENVRYSSPRYKVTYTFEAYGETMESFSFVAISDGDKLGFLNPNSAGKKITVYYDPDDPSVNRVERKPMPDAQSWIPIIPGIALIIAGIVFYKAAKSGSLMICYVDGRKTIKSV